MNEEDRATLAALVVELCRQTLAPGGEPFEVVIVDPAPAVDPESTVVASVGLADPDMKGALAVVAPLSFLRATYPIQESAATANNEDLADWAGELTNQLLGRLKNRLAPFGLNFSIGSPVVIKGAHLRIRFKNGPICVGCKLKVRNERVDVFLEAARASGGVLLVSCPGAVSSSSEGDALLF
jgi:CheY-specific phosphatase CheX